MTASEFRGLLVHMLVESYIYMSTSLKQGIFVKHYAPLKAL